MAEMEICNSRVIGKLCLQKISELVYFSKHLYLNWIGRSKNFWGGVDNGGRKNVTALDLLPLVDFRI